MWDGRFRKMSSLDTTVELIEVEKIKKSGATWNVTCSHLSSNNEYFFWGTEKGDVFVQYRNGTGNIKKLGSHLGRVLCLCYNPHNDVKMLFSGSSDHTIQVYNVEAGKRIQTLDYHNNSVLCMEYSGDMIISGSIDRTFKFFKTDRDRLNNSLKPMFVEKVFSKLKYPNIRPKKKDWVTAIWTSKVSRTHYDMLIGDNIGNLTFLMTYTDPLREGVVTDTRITRYKPCKFGILFVHVTNVYVILTYNNNSICLYDLMGRAKFHTIDWKYQIKKSLYNHEQNADEIIFLSEDTLNFYNLNRNRMVCRKKFQENVGSMILSGTKLFIQKYDGFALFDIRRTLPFINCKAHKDPIICLVANLKPLKRELLPDEKEELLVYMVSQDSNISMCVVTQFDFKMKTKTLVKKKRDEIYCSVHVPPKCIISGHTEGWLSFYNFMDGKVQYYKPHPNTCSALTFFKNKNKLYLVSGDFAGMLVRCNISTFVSLGRNPSFERKTKASYSAILCVTYAEDYETIITGDGDGLIGFFASDLINVSKFRGHEEGVTAMIVHHQFLFSSSEDGVIKKWNLTKDFSRFEKKGLMEAYSFHEAHISVMTFHPETKDAIISTDRNGKLIIWDFKNKEIVFQYQKRGTEITAVAVLKGQIFIGLGDGNCIKLQNMGKVKNYGDQS